MPVYNGARFLPRSLKALAESSYPVFELIVVDDCSTDNSVEIARKKGATVYHTPSQSGPSAARNLGAEKASGTILFFVDADVVVQPGALERVAADFYDNPEVDALFGSYDDDPAERNFISQYKNLFHHFVHQQSSPEAVSFWSGCGAVRRDVFLAVGGFDAERFPRAIEDIELGYRLRSNGHRILLDKHLQGKHLKEWRLKSWLYEDIFRRAVPWSNLILESKGLVNDLNLRTSDRVSAMLVALSLAILPCSLLKPSLLFIIPLLLGLIPILNHRLYRFFFQRKGLWFAILAFPLHVSYYLYSGVAFVLCWLRHFFQSRQVATLKGFTIWGLLSVGQAGVPLPV